MNEPVALYGLFDPNEGSCKYIGQTIYPKQREEDHNHFEKGRGRDLSFIILAWVEPIDADLLETKLIAVYRAKGEANLNKRLKACANTRVKNNSYVILWTEKVLKFNGYSEAARYFKCSAQTISNAINKYNGRLIGYGHLVKLAASSKTPAKQAASKENGKKGGRPKKIHTEG